MNCLAIHSRSNPSKLGQEEFGALIEALEIRGFEVATAEGTRLTPLHDTVSLDAELRVRHDALATPSASLLRTTGSDRADSTKRRPLELGDYERASLRLELLTAGLDLEHATHELVAKCVEIAAAGLAIPSVEQVLLGRVASAFAQTFREPLGVLTGLVRRLDAEDGEVLLREYAALHPDREELQSVLSDHWAALCETRRAAISGYGG